MKPNLFMFLFSAIAAVSCTKVKSKPSDAPNQDSSGNFHQFNFKNTQGETVNFSDFKGKKVLVVNVASECGFTSQYKSLQQLHEKYGDKIVVLAFPCNQFGGQEPGSNNQIKQFCEKNYGVTFTVLQKSDVIGKNQNLVYQWLTNKAQNGWNQESPGWNFCKYLIDENGQLIRFFSSRVNPMDNEILDLL